MRTMETNRCLVAALGVFVIAGLAGGARAQAQSAQPPAQSAATPSADGARVEEVVVTARRRNETVQNTPVAVTALSPTVLAELAAPDVRDIAGRVPNLVLDQVTAGPSAAAISIRGISFEDIEKSFDPAVGVLIDGVYIGTNTGQLTDAFDLQSLEVIRGPQGTLFGRNTTGGVINLRRTLPTGNLNVYIDTIQGDYGRQDYHAVINLPEIAGVSTKFFYSHRQSDGYVNNVTLNRDDTASTDIERYGLTFLWKPRQEFDYLLTVEHAIENSRTDQGSLSRSTDLVCSNALPAFLSVPPFQPPRNQCNRNTKGDLYTTFSQSPQLARNDEVDITGEGTLRLPGVTLTSVTGFRTSHERTDQDFDGTSAPFYETTRPQRYHQISQEGRAAGNITQNLDYVVGFYYFDSAYQISQGTFFGPLLQVAAGLPATTFQNVRHNSTSYAVFGDVNWKVTDRLRITVGGRQTWDDKDIFNTTPSFAVRAQSSWDQFTPKASVDYRLSPDILSYVSYAKGYRAGGFNGRASTLTSAATPYDPETVDSYELGLKTEFFDRRLRLNAAAFMADYNNKQEEVVSPTPAGSPNPQETLVVNAATATIRGLEFDAEVRPMKGLTLRGTLGLLDASYDTFRRVDAARSAGANLVFDDLTALHLRRTPDVTGGVGLDYAHPVSFGLFTFTSDFRYTSPYDTTITPGFGTAVYVGAGCAAGNVANNCSYVQARNDDRGRTAVRNIWDISGGFEHELGGGRGKIRISAFARNLLDERSLGNALPVAGLFTFGVGIPPRTVGMQLSYKY